MPQSTNKLMESSIVSGECKLPFYDTSKRTPIAEAGATVVLGGEDALKKEFSEEVKGVCPVDKFETVSIYA